MKVYWWPIPNFGDTLTPIILKYLEPDIQIEQASKTDTGRLLSVGSIIHFVRENDVVFGSGSNRPGKDIKAPKGSRFLSVRGPLTRAQISGAVVPEIYGDPAILLPRIYRPTVARKHKIGLIPHYVDKPLVKAQNGALVIDILADWKQVIDQILSCEKIISSSLHGIIAAEAYGIPAEWAIYGTKIVGGEYKFQDYFLGTGRSEQRPGIEIPPIPDLAARQDLLEDTFRKFYRSEIIHK